MLIFSVYINLPDGIGNLWWFAQRFITHGNQGKWLKWYFRMWCHSKLELLNISFFENLWNININAWKPWLLALTMAHHGHRWHQASLLGMSPLISDQFDTVKDVVFAGLCVQCDGAWDGRFLSSSPGKHPGEGDQVVKNTMHWKRMEQVVAPSYKML